MRVISWLVKQLLVSLGLCSIKPSVIIRPNILDSFRQSRETVRVRSKSSTHLYQMACKYGDTCPALGTRPLNVERRQQADNIPGATPGY